MSDRMRKVLFEEVLFDAVSHQGEDSPAHAVLDGAGEKVPEHRDGDLKVSEPAEEVEEVSFA